MLYIDFLSDDLLEILISKLYHFDDYFEFSGIIDKTIYKNLNYIFIYLHRFSKINAYRKKCLLDLSTKQGIPIDIPYMDEYLSSLPRQTYQQLIYKLKQDKLKK